MTGLSSTIYVTLNLVVKVNIVTNHQSIAGLCSICGVEDECTFHALVSCPKARALRLALRRCGICRPECFLKILGQIGFLFYWIN